MSLQEGDRRVHIQDVFVVRTRQDKPRGIGGVCVPHVSDQDGQRHEWSQEHPHKGDR